MIRQSLRRAACAAAVLASCCFAYADDKRLANESDNQPDTPVLDGQSPTAAHAEATGCGLQISLKVAQTTWKYGDKIDLVCTYRNVSSEPIRVPSWGTASEFVKSGFSGLEFVDANEKVLTCYMGTGIPFIGAPSAVPAFVEIPAGRSEHFIMTIQRDPTTGLLTVPLTVPGSAVWLSWNLPADQSQLRVRAFVDTTRRQRLLWQQEVGEGVRKIWRGNLRTELVKIEVDTQPRNVAAIDVRLSTTKDGKLIYKPGDPINIEVAKTNTSRRDQPIWHCGFWPNHELTVLYADGTRVPLTEVGRQCARAFDPDAPRDKDVSLELKYHKVDREGPFDLTKYFELQPGRAFVVRCRYMHESRGRQGAIYLWSNDLLLRVEPTEKTTEQSGTERREKTDKDEQRPLELGPDKALIEILPDDERNPGLHAIGSIEQVDANLAMEVISLHEKETKTRGNYGTTLARAIYLLHESGKIAPGCRALVGRIDGDVMFRNGFECLSYSRKGREIEIEVAHFTELGGLPAAAYVYVPLPELPPGRYSVSMNFISAWRIQMDGEVRIAEQQRPSLCSPLACTFEVPAPKAVETDPSQNKPGDARLDPKVKPPKITLRAANMVRLGDQPFFSLTLEVVNPNGASLTYTGYAPDSFDPPIPQGRIAPLFQVELQRDGKWEPYPIGRCLTGVTDLQLAPKSSATFEVGVPATLAWQAIKVSFGQLAGWVDEEVTTTTIWTREFTREEFEKLHNLQ